MLTLSMCVAAKVNGNEQNAEVMPASELERPAGKRLCPLASALLWGHIRVKVLVTDVAGFIGYHLARRLVGQGHQVLGIDNLNRYYDVRLKLDRLRELGITATNLESEATVPMDTNDSSLRFLRVDIVDHDRVLGLFAHEGFDTVCHLAAQAGVRHSLVDPCRTS